MNQSADPRYTSEQEVLLWAIRIDHASDERVAAILRTGLDWGYLQETAVRQGIMPLLYRRLKGEIADLVPPDELSAIQRLFMQNTMWNMRMTRHLLSILDLLAGSGIEAVPFKGPALAAQAYGDLSMRKYGDLDILIHASDVSQAYRILTGQGYTLTNPGQIKKGRLFGFLYQKDLIFTFQGLILELHWKLIEQMYAVSLEMEQLFDRSRPVLINGRQYAALSPEDTVLLLTFHGYKHVWQNLGLLADLIYMISNHPEIQWHDLFIRAENLGLKRIVLTGLFLAHRYGGIRCGSEFENLFASDTAMLELASEIQHKIFQVPPATHITPLLYLRSRERFRDQVMYLLYYSVLLPIEFFSRKMDPAAV